MTEIQDINSTQGEGYLSTSFLAGNVLKVYACLENYLTGNEDTESLIKDLQQVLYEGELSGKLCSLLLNVFHNCSICYVYYESFSCFIRMSVSSILVDLRCQKEHLFFLFDFGDGMILVQDSKLYGIGKNYVRESLQKILDIFQIINNGKLFSWDFAAISCPAEKYTRMHLVEIVSRLVNNQELRLECDDLLRIRTASKALGMQLPEVLNSSINEIASIVESKCVFSYVVPLSSCTLTEVKYFVAYDGQLFRKEIRHDTLFKELKEMYESLEVGNLSKEICYEVLNFVMTQRDDINSYYFLKSDIDKNDRDRIKKMFTNNKTMAKRGQLQFHSEERMMKCIPAMLFRCIDTVLQNLLRDRKRGSFAKNDIVNNVFTLYDHIKLVVTKRVVMTFLIEKAGVSVEDLQAHIGVIGES